MYDIAHIGVIVEDIERSASFYHEAFGCEVAGGRQDERLRIVYLKAGSGIIELLKYSNDNEKRGKGVVDHIAFNVPDMEEAVERALDAGAKKIFDSPRESDGKRIMFISGPDNERIEFVEDK